MLQQAGWRILVLAFGVGTALAGHAQALDRFSVEPDHLFASYGASTPDKRFTLVAGVPRAARYEIRRPGNWVHDSVAPDVDTKATRNPGLGRPDTHSAVLSARRAGHRPPMSLAADLDAGGPPIVVPAAALAMTPANAAPEVPQEASDVRPWWSALILLLLLAAWAWRVMRNGADLVTFESEPAAATVTLIDSADPDDAVSLRVHCDPGRAYISATDGGRP